jgi:hypothetical protein
MLGIINNLLFTYLQISTYLPTLFAEDIDEYDSEYHVEDPIAHQQSQVPN